MRRVLAALVVGALPLLGCGQAAAPFAVKQIVVAPPCPPACPPLIESVLGTQAFATLAPPIGLPPLTGLCGYLRATGVAVSAQSGLVLERAVCPLGSVVCD